MELLLNGHTYSIKSMDLLTASIHEKNRNLTWHPIKVELYCKPDVEFGNIESVIIKDYLMDADAEIVFENLICDNYIIYIQQIKYCTLLKVR